MGTRNDAVDDIECAAPGCPATVRNHRWGRTQAEGWFFGRDRVSWCPDHVPEWVAGWRKSKQA